MPTILNLTDGILASVLKIAVIVTYNYERDKIDPALLRKGRLRIEHNFDLLTAEEANVVLKKMGKDYRTDIPMSLADIYNLEEDTFRKEEIKENRSMGFGSA